MAPEHLEALIERKAGRIDHRSDLYSLGLVLLEAVGFPTNRSPAEHADGGRSLVPVPGGQAIGPARNPSRGADRFPPPSRPFCGVAWPPTRPTGTARRPSWRPTCKPWPTPLRSDSPASRWPADWPAGFRRNRLRMAVAIPILAVLAGFTAAWFQSQANRLRQEIGSPSTVLAGPAMARRRRLRHGRDPVRDGCPAGRGLAGTARPQARCAPVARGGPRDG